MGWERKRGKLQRAQRAAARRRRDTTSCRPDRRAVDAARRRALRDHARRRHAAAARRGRAGSSATMAHPLNRPRFDRRRGRVDRGLRHPAAARQPSLPAEHEALALQRVFSGAGRHRSVHARRSPTSTRTCSARALHRQGHLRRRRVRARARRPRARERDPQPRPARGHLRARRPGHRRRAVRGLPVALPDVAAARQHRWVRGDWQLLPWILGRRARRAGRGARSRCPASRAGRCSTTCAAPCRRRPRWSRAGRRLDRAAASAVLLDRVRRWRSSSLPAAAAVLSSACCRAGRASRRRSHLRRVARGCCARASRRSRWRSRCSPHEAWLDGRRDRAHAVARCSSAAGSLLEWTTAAQAKAERTPRPRAASTGTMAGGVALAAVGRRARAAPLEPAAALVAAPFVLAVARSRRRSRDG